MERKEEVKAAVRAVGVVKEKVTVTKEMKKKKMTMRTMRMMRTIATKTKNDCSNSTRPRVILR